MTTTEAPNKAVAELTDGELQVLILASYGLTNVQIGQRVYLSEDGVKSRMREIVRKWGIQSRTGLVAHALRNGVIQ